MSMHGGDSSPHSEWIGLKNKNKYTKTKTKKPVVNQPSKQNKAKKVRIAPGVIVLLLSWFLTICCSFVENWATPLWSLWPTVETTARHNTCRSSLPLVTLRWPWPFVAVPVPLREAQVLENTSRCGHPVWCWCEDNSKVLCGLPESCAPCAVVNGVKCDRISWTLFLRLFTLWLDYGGCAWSKKQLGGLQKWSTICFFGWHHAGTTSTT